MIDAAHRAVTANFEVITSLGALQAAQDAAARGAGVDAAVQSYLADATADAARANAEAATAADAAGDAAVDQAGKTAAATEASRAAADAARDQAVSDAALVTANKAVGDSALASAAKQDAATSVTAGFWARWGNVIHWVVAGSAELLAVTLPAAVAVGAGAFVLYQGAVEEVGFRLQALYGTTEATAAMIGKTTGDVLGLGHAFQTAQNEANPIAYELLGEYIDAAKSHMVDLAQAGLQVDRALAGLGAHIDVDLIQQGGELNSLLANMTSDLLEIGQVFGNLGHAILNLAADMPGLAEALLAVIDGLSKAVLFLSNPAWYNFGGHLITIAMGFEEFSRWGGLAVTILSKMGLATTALSGGLFSVERFTGIFQNLIGILPMAALGVANLASRIPVLGAAIVGTTADVEAARAATMEWIAGLTTLQAVGILGAVAGLGLMWWALSSSKTAAQQFADSLQQAADKANNLQVTGVLLNNISQLTPRLSQATSATNQFSASLNHTVDAGHAAIGIQTVLRMNQDAYSSALKSTDTQLSNTEQGAAYLAKTYGTNLATAEALADVAGVKLAKGITGTSTAAMQARAEVAGLVAGYKAMDQTGGILANDMNALAAQTGLADTKVSSLNQAWDQFLSNTTGLTSNFAGLKTDIGEINNAITTAGTKFDVFGGKAVSSTQEAAYAMTSFSGIGAQVWQNYDSALQQAEQYTDSLRIAATTGAVGQREFTQQIAYTAQQLLPYARYSKAATSELSVLVQEAGGPATSNFKTLKEWIDKNTESSKKFDRQTVSETGAMSDATSVAEDYASTLDSQVAAALQAATISSVNLTGAAEGFDNAITKAGGHLSGPVQSAFAGLITSLFKVYGNTKTAEGIANDYARQLGLTGGQVKTLDREVQGLIAQLNKIPAHVSTTVTTNFIDTGTPGTGKGGILPTPSGHQAGTWAAAAGLAVVGESGPELVRFGGGEQVTPSWQTAPLLHGGGGGGGESTLNLNARIPVSFGGQVLGQATIRQSLVYQRRNPSNNLSLRHR
jgi:hypothetical protein